MTRGGVLFEYFRTHDVGRHEISGVNWMRLKERDRHFERVLIRRVLPRPGTPVRSVCPPCQQGDEEFVQDVLLADDDFAEFGGQAFLGFGGLLYNISFAHGRGSGSGWMQVVWKRDMGWRKNGLKSSLDSCRRNG